MTARARRTIAISGAASGIGAACRALLEARGHTVIGIDIRDAGIVADLGTAAGRQQAIEQVRGLAVDGLDGLITCAGLSTMTADTRRIVAVNYFGSAALLDGLRELLARGDRPAAVALSSFALLLPIARADVVAACLEGDEACATALLPDPPLAGDGRMAYASSKLAIARYVRGQAPREEWAGAGIALNAIAPAVTRTPMIAPQLATAAGTRALLESVPSPMKRIAEPDDVAELACFLVSGAARHVAGQVIFVDAGLESLRRDAAVLTPLDA